MLDNFISLTDTGEFEDSGGLRLSSIQATSGGLTFEVILVPGDNTGEQRWSIQCSFVRDYRLDRGFADTIRVVSQHQVLLPFTEHITDLYFSCSARNPLETVGALWERHRELIGHWLPFERFLNVAPKSLSSLLVEPSGQLASGPASLVRAYAEV